MGEPTELEKFEKWHQEKFGYVVARHENGYLDLRMDMRWQGWQVHAEQTAAEIRRLKERMDCGHFKANLVQLRLSNDPYPQPVYGCSVCHDRDSLKNQLSNEQGDFGIVSTDLAIAQKQLATVQGQIEAKNFYIARVITMLDEKLCRTAAKAAVLTTLSQALSNTSEYAQHEKKVLLLRMESHLLLAEVALHCSDHRILGAAKKLEEALVALEEKEASDATTP